MIKIQNDINEVKEFSRKLAGARDLENFETGLRLIDAPLKNIESTVGCADMIEKIRKRLQMIAICLQNKDGDRCAPLEEALAELDELSRFVAMNFMPE